MSTLDWSKKRCIVLDMDGTVYLGNNPYSPQSTVLCATGSASTSFLEQQHLALARKLCEKLNGMGIAARLDQFLTPTEPWCII